MVMAVGCCGYSAINAHLVAGEQESHMAAFKVANHLPSKVIGCCSRCILITPAAGKASEA